MVDEAKIDSLVKAAVFAELDGVEFIQDFDYAALCSGYNGIGPEWMPAALREKVSAYLDLFAPAALIHDMRYQVGDGSRFNFNYANLEFYGNCVDLEALARPRRSPPRVRLRAGPRRLEGLAGLPREESCARRIEDLTQKKGKQ